MKQVQLNSEHDDNESYVAMRWAPDRYSVHAIHTTGFFFADEAALRELMQRVPVRVVDNQECSSAKDAIYL
jgi:hypothetical protein